MKCLTIRSTAYMLVFCSIAVWSANKHLPLATQVITAKTAYVENRSGSAKFADQIYQEVVKWSRFQVVQDKKQADLILILTSTTDPDSFVFRQLAVVDPTTGDTLWIDSRLANGGPAKFLVGELKKRIEEQLPRSSGATKSR